MIVWMKVTDDRYELPELIAYSAIELADMCGVSKNSVYSANSRYRSGQNKHSVYQRVEIELERGDEEDVL